LAADALKNSLLSPTDNAPETVILKTLEC